MKTTDVYERYFEGECEYNGRPRHAAAVKLTAESDSGTIKYTVSVNFFPHDSADDFAVSYDAYFENVIFEGKGRRSKKKEEKYISNMTEQADGGSREHGELIFWDKPLIDERRG